MVARSSVFTFKGRNPDLREVARQLLEHVLEGSIRPSGAGLAVSVRRLIDAATGRLMWSNHLAGLRTPAQAVPPVSRGVASTLGLSYARPLRPPQADAEVDDLILRTRYEVLRYLPERTLRGLEYASQAVTLNPSYAPAHLAMASAKTNAAVLSLSPRRETWQEVKEHARRAIQLDDSLAEAHSLLGWTLHAADWDHEAAERELRRAVRLAPGGADAHRTLAYFLAMTGQLREAAGEMQRARALDPFDLETARQSAELAIFRGDYAGALAQYERLAVRLGDAALAFDRIARIHALEGHYAPAEAAVRRWAAVEPEGDRSKAALAILRAQAGFEPDRRDLRRLLASPVNQPPNPARRVRLALAVADLDQALVWLARAIEEGDVRPGDLLVWPDYTPLHTRAEYLDLIRHVRLEKQFLALHPRP